MMQEQPLGSLIREYTAYEIWQDDASVSMDIIQICDERTDELLHQILPLLTPFLRGVPKKQHIAVFRALINKFANGPEQKQLKALVSFEKK